MVGYTANLTIGGTTLAISSGRYALRYFVPPSASEIINVAGGLSSNRTLGGELAGRRAANQQIEFEIRVMGASQAEVEAGVADLITILRMAGSNITPLYLEYCPHGYVAYKPTWGQDQWKRLEIVSATVNKGDMSFLHDVRSRAQVVTVSAEIRPYAFGLSQRLATAVGGVFEDYIGDVLGISRGLRIPEGTTNKMTNPVFGHATFGNGWTAGSALTAVANYDKRFVLFGYQSAKIYTNHATANNTYTQSINVGNTNAHTVSLYVKKLDGSAVTSSDCRVYYGAGVASTYQSLGNGWYRVYAAVTGVAAGTATGIELRAVGAGVYLAAAQIEEKAYPTLIAYGDMLGVAWDGTAHAGTSTRTAASLAIDSQHLNVISGSARAILEMDCDQTAGDTTIFQHYDSAAKLDCYFKASDDKFYLTDGTNTISSSAQTWSVGDKIVLHATWTSGALNLYKNGANIATGSTYTPPSQGGTVYVGADQGAAENLRGLVMDFVLWDRALSATEIGNDYANVVQIAADGQRVGSLPWMHSPAQNSLDDTTMCGGIPGSADADTWIEITHANESTLTDFYINLYSLPRYSSITAGGANYLYRTTISAVTVGTDPTMVDSTTPLAIDYDVDYFAGQKAWIMSYMKDASSTTVYAAATCWITGSAAYTTSSYRPISMTTSDTYYLLGPVRLPQADNFSDILETAYRLKISAACNLYRSTGSADIDVNAYRLLVGRIARIDKQNTGSEVCRLHGRTARLVDTSGPGFVDTPPVLGDLIELSPGMINHICIMYCNDSGTGYGTPTISQIHVIPRWLTA